MALSEDEKVAMVAATHEAAHVLVDDLAFLRRVFAKPNVSSGDVRRTSVILRRLWIDNHLQVVAVPRFGKISLPIPDLRSQLDLPGDFVTVGFAPMFGWPDRLFDHYRTSFDEGGKNFLELAGEASAPDRIVSIDGLMTDPILRFETEFVSRGDAVKFVCYHAFGAHLSGKDSRAFDVLRRVRYAITFREDESGAMVIDLGNRDRERKEHILDFVHAHVFATAFYLANAPDVRSLEAIIGTEWGNGQGAP
jgi:hypothetical protein